MDEAPSPRRARTKRTVPDAKRWLKPSHQHRHAPVCWRPTDRRGANASVVDLKDGDIVDRPTVPEMDGSMGGADDRYRLFK
jgi:hypothetical protein